MKTQQMEIYFNTNRLEGEKLQQAKIKAGTQNAEILELFQAEPDRAMTPFQVQWELQWHRVPITSIRRAMTTLTKLGYLEKTEEMEEGKYGTENHKWKLRREADHGFKG